MKGNKRNYTKKTSEYNQTHEDISIEGRPIVAGPLFHTSAISKILHCIMELLYL